MLGMNKVVLQALALLVVALVGLAMDVNTAYAQAGSCARLQATLDRLENNSDFRGSGGSRDDLRRLQRDVQRDESRYIREGCNADAKAGRRLSTSCRALAREITTGREQVKQLSGSVSTGNAVQQQREAILQEMARFGCDSRSRSRVERRGNLFERLFEAFGSDSFDGEGGVRGEEFTPYGGYHTVRTLCVRKTDGFYWPISYSTLVDYVANDAQQCAAQCPGLDVELYYYDNPGQEPEQMINQWGEPYSNLPNAFRFRTEFDESSKCRSTVDSGQVAMVEQADGGTTAIVSFNGASFPLPQRDPRRIATRIIEAPSVQTASFVDVPLPRRRPAAPGEEPLPVAVPQIADAPVQQRIVKFGDKRVRVVGPDTPYVRAAEAGT